MLLLIIQATTEVKTVEDNHQQFEQQLQEQQQHLGQLQTSLAQLQAWKAENNTRQPIAENIGLISSKLSDAQALLDAAHTLLPKLEGTLLSITEAKLAKIDLEQKLVDITELIQAEKEQLTLLSQVLATISISNVEKEKLAIDTSIEDLIAAEAQWKLLSHSEGELTILEQKLAGNESELSNNIQSLNKASEQLVIATAERDASFRMLDIAKLAASEKVESLRSLLTPEEPCPVCGSKEHPYVTEHPQLNHVLAELETAYDLKDKAYSICLQTESSLQETIKQLKEIITLQEQETDTKETTLAAHQKTWERFAIYPKSIEIHNEQKAIWLAQQLKDSRAQQKNLQQQILLYAERKLEQDAIQKRMNELEYQLNESNNALKDIDRRLQSLQEHEVQYNKEQQTNNHALATIEQLLSDYFAVPDWFTYWKNDPAIFLKRIIDFAEQWKATINKMEEDSRQHSILYATLESTKEQLQNISNEVQKKQAALTDLTQQRDTLTQKRKAIFNGEAASTIEQSLKQAVTAAQQALEKIKSETELLQTSLTRVGTQIEQAENDVLFLQQQLASFAQKIQEWLTIFNSRNVSILDEERLLQLLGYDANWMEKERAALKLIDDGITQAQSVLQERRAQLLQHEQQRISDRSVEMLSELLNTAKTELQQQVKRKNEIDFQMQQDLDNKQRIGDLLRIIESKGLVAENWAKLNEIIGSADGKKFRLIAQEYTLDILLSYANVHLGMLSNRYLLQRIPNTLGLQVIDQDMGYEVRTVYSLSGGESFLASLALALGLASLSSSRMQVESLFIDEGFGSLDPATLNIAMDALERLHNQGRKVGVISHVQEMTERIPVQIKVSKQQSGRSKVEVMSI